MAIMAKYIDSAMSKTLNLPNEYPYEDFKRLYKELYDTKVIKGGTTYRTGTMTSVLSEKSTSETSSQNEDSFKRTNAPKRPKTLECDIHHLSVSGDKWIVLVGMYDNYPYEVFAFKKKSINISEKVKSGKLTKIKRGRYDLELEFFTLENIKEHFETNEQEALTRMISTAMRHGADINFIYDQLMKSEGTIISFSKAIARTLKKYIKDESFDVEDCPECGSKGTLIRQEGCFKCLNCSWSKC
jgi:ribonucleoside-diphosphate reductase alpha chain